MLFIRVLSQKKGSKNLIFARSVPRGYYFANYYHTLKLESDKSKVYLYIGGYLRQKFFAKKIGLGGKEARCSELSVSRLQRSTGNESVCFV